MINFGSFMVAESKTRMTEGSISKKIILFAIPLFLGNLFQQLYNTADSLIVGNYLGSSQFVGEPDFPDGRFY